MSGERAAGKCPRPPVKRTPSGGYRQVASRCFSRRCPSCGQLWAGDVRVKLLRNIEEFGGAVALVTITAPGSDELPWDESICEHLGPHVHSGGRGCRIHELAAHLWNEQAPADWRLLHRRASQRAKRTARRWGGRWSVVAMEWEFQKRGVLHRHVVVPMATSLDRLCSQLYAQTLAEGAKERGFGYVDRGKRTPRRTVSASSCTARSRTHGWPAGPAGEAKPAAGSPSTERPAPDVLPARTSFVWDRLLEVVPPQRAARYLAKYIAAVGGDGKLSLSETVHHRDVPGHVCFVSRDLTRRTGCTMRSLRRHRYAWWLLRRHTVPVPASFIEAFAPGADPSTDEDIIEWLSPLGP